MFIGVARFELFIPASTSLKDKRQVLRSVIDGIRKRYNVSIAEVDFQDLWQRAAIGVTCVSGSSSQCVKVMNEIDRAVTRSAIDGAEVSGRSIDVYSEDDL
ncbi:MAG: uncharacterized protein QOC87_802 [Actinomycetota bacterium]|jgi:uncharacterized protein YlxP (DUF503 family)|nr:uncharacterized protein [Actinomycetota bacterium]